MTTSPRSPTESFSALLSRYMEEHHLASVLQFAQQAALKPTTIYELLKGGERQTYPSLPTLIQLASALEMPTHELLYIFAPDAPGAPSRKQNAKDRLRAIGRQLPGTDTFLAQRRLDSQDEQ